MSNFPPTNKIRQEQIDSSFGNNAKLIEERLSKLNWSLIIKNYAIALTVISVTVFVLIAVVRLAMKI